MKEMLVNAVKKQIEKMDLSIYCCNEERGVFSIPFPIGERVGFIETRIRVENKFIIVHSECPVRPDKDDDKGMAAVAEFVCRANYGLNNGNFEFDFNDGELRYKCFIDCDEAVPSDDIIENGIVCSVMMFKRYAPGIVKVIFEGVSPKDAIHECEDDNPLEQLLRKIREDKEIEEILDGVEECDDEETSVDGEESNDAITDGIPSQDEYLAMQEAYAVFAGEGDVESAV